jgi:hypothetical protein
MRTSTILLTAALLSGLLFSACKVFPGLARRNSGKRVNPNPTIAYGPSDIVTVVAGLEADDDGDGPHVGASSGGYTARRWSPSDPMNSTGTDYAIAILTGCNNTGAYNYRRPLGGSGTTTAVKVDPQAKYSLFYDRDSARWFFVGTNTTDDDTYPADSGIKGGQLCISVSNSSTFPTTASGWKAQWIDVPNAPYCPGGGCENYAYIMRPSVGISDHLVTISGVRRNDGVPAGSVPTNNHWACEEESIVFAVNKSDLVSWVTPAAKFTYLPPASTANNCGGVAGDLKDHAPRLMTPVQDLEGYGKAMLVGIYDHGVVGACLLGRPCEETSECNVDSLGLPMACTSGYCSNGTACTSTGDCQVRTCTAGDCYYPCEYGPTGPGTSTGTAKLKLTEISSSGTRTDTLIDMPASTSDDDHKFYRARSWTPQGMNGEFIDGRGMLGAKPHFENAVYGDTATIWTVATVGNEYGATEPGAMNKVRVVGIKRVSNVWTVTQSILKDSELAAQPSSVFAPSIWVPTTDVGGSPPPEVILVAQRVGVKSHVEMVLSGRHTFDAQNTLRPWTARRANDPVNFQPLDQPIPYYFGRITGITGNQDNTSWAVVWTEPDSESGLVGSMGGPGTATGDWQTWVATFDVNDLPSS